MLQLLLLPLHGFFCLFLLVFCVCFLSLCTKVLICFHKFADTLFHYIPIQKHFCIRVAVVTFLKTDTLCVMIFMCSVMSRKCMGASTRSVFIFQKGYILFLAVTFLKILIDTEFAMFKSTSSGQPVINFILCDEILMFHFHCIR